jgi:lipopolysaccharide cholinephosphotransferase
MSKLREIQLVQLQILTEFDRICKKNDINYQLFAGTLLGAVRHKGFIPWDDDVDVCMLRSEYDRFLEIAQQELDNEFFLQTTDTDPEYYHQFARIRKNGTFFHQHKYERFDIHKGIFIDVFPLDAISDNVLARCIQLSLIRSVRYVYIQSSILQKRPPLDTEQNICLRFIKGLYRMLFKLPGFLPLRKLLDSLYCCNNTKNRRYVTHLTNGVQNKRWKKYRIPRDDLSESIVFEFEGHRFPGPRDADACLTQLYGNYHELPPKEQQVPNHLKAIT